MKNARILPIARGVSRSEEAHFRARSEAVGGRPGRVSEGSRELDAIVELVGVFGDDPIDDYGRVEIVLGIKPQALLDARRDEVVDEVHSSSGFEPISRDQCLGFQ